MIWLIPVVYQQLQSLILEIPKWVNSLMLFAQEIPGKYPDLVSSDQITAFLQSLSGEITSISQDFFKSFNYWHSKYLSCCSEYNLATNSCIFLFV